MCEMLPWDAAKCCCTFPISDPPLTPPGLKARRGEEVGDQLKTLRVGIPKLIPERKVS